jgi:hypothetical protein
MRVAARLAMLVVAAGLLSVTGGGAAMSNESNCRQLEDLARQYAGVRLTSDQQRLKRKLVAWYKENCRRTRNARR